LAWLPSSELIERNLRLGLEFDLLGNTRLLAALGILGPFLRQIESAAAMSCMCAQFPAKFAQKFVTQ
jgi:hypothetical protein